jgi:arginine dihydrolase
MDEMITRDRDFGARILMCAPEHFEVSYSINPWMDPTLWTREAASLGLAARREWKRLKQKLEQLGASIELVPPVKGLPDLVFTANAAVVLDGVALVASFRYPERQPEAAHYERSFRELWARGIIDAVRLMPEGVLLEGAGDCVWDPARQMFWTGCGPRSDRAAARVVSETYAVDALPLELVNPSFYHMDTALSTLPRGEVMYVPAAFSPEGLREIHARVAPEQRIELGAKDASVFAANAVKLGDDIVMSSCSAGLRRRLEEAGYRVHPTSLATYHRSGGSAFCLTLRLDQRSARAEAAQPQAQVS